MVDGVEFVRESVVDGRRQAQPRLAQIARQLQHTTTRTTHTAVGFVSSLRRSAAEQTYGSDPRWRGVVPQVVEAQGRVDAPCRLLVAAGPHQAVHLVAAN